jgi:hypothetical protein
MLARRALFGCLVSLSVGLPIAQAGKDEDPLAPTKGRKLDTESPVAKALDELLRIDPRYAEDGTVELIYETAAAAAAAPSAAASARGRRCRSARPAARRASSCTASR